MKKITSLKLNALKKIPCDLKNMEFSSIVNINSSEYLFDESKQKIFTKGLGKIDKSAKDLIEIIIVQDVLEATYFGTGVLIPRTLAESFDVIPTHATAQAIIFTVAEEETSKDIQNMAELYKYGCTEYDHLWIESRPLNKITPGEVLMLMNRRVGGWDGSTVCPVIELLCAGGHVPVLWNHQICNFFTSTPEETVQREIEEEIGLNPIQYELSRLGGFYNTITSELVILFAIILPWKMTLKIQDNSFGNFKENINGLYVGSFEYTMERYMQDATPFAGGERSKSTNFPSQLLLMERIKKIVSKIDMNFK